MTNKNNEWELIKKPPAKHNKPVGHDWVKISGPVNDPSIKKIIKKCLQDKQNNEHYASENGGSPEQVRAAYWKYVNSTRKHESESHNSRRGKRDKNPQPPKWELT